MVGSCPVTRHQCEVLRIVRRVARIDRIEPALRGPFGQRVMTSLYQAFENLEKKIRKERDKWRERKRRGGRERKEQAPPVEGEEPVESVRRVIPSRNFSLKPMSLEEALIQLDIRNKEAFAFRREDSEKWAVVFRRKDGHLGLIEPE